MAGKVIGMRAFTSHERRIMRTQLIEKYGAVCQLCVSKGYSVEIAAIDMTTTGKDKSFSIDHIVPLGNGGPNVIDNMQPTHVICNNRKGSHEPNIRRVRNVTGVRLAYTSSSC